MKDGSCDGRVQTSITRKYKGCYKDSGDRDLPISIRQGARDYTMGTCAQECYAKSQKYFALQSSGQCFCGNSFGKHGTCGPHDTTCNDAKKLGGSYKNCVFSTGV